VPFRLLVRRAVLREVGNGRYYLDEPTWTALRSMRHRVVAVVLALLVIVFLAGGFFISRQ
jgi:hypothetical protein